MMNRKPEAVGSEPNTGKYSLSLKSRKTNVMIVAPFSLSDWAAQEPPDFGVSIDLFVSMYALMRRN
jgi:hypothetical protein